MDIFQTIFGAIGLAFVGYKLAKFVRLPLPGAVGGMIFLICLCTFLTYPRYRFEQDVSLWLSNNREYVVVNEANYGAIIEPLTWFISFRGFVRAARPDPQFDTAQYRAFHAVIFRYEEDPKTLRYLVDCRRGIAKWIEYNPDGGVFYDSGLPDPMSDVEQKSFCTDITAP